MGDPMQPTGTVIGVPRERAPGETRVALVPASVGELVKGGLEVVVEKGAGALAGFDDDAYAAHGAELGDRRAALEADVVVRVRGWGDDDDLTHPDQVAVGLADPLDSPAAVRAAAERKLTAFALELVPRITRAQGMDALSSQATVMGYKAVLLAADRLPTMLPLMTTAAGTIPPAPILVVGAGVAGLQAIATARRLGAVVQAFDVRAAARADIESLGARCVMLEDLPDDASGEGGYATELAEEALRRQQELMARVASGVEIVILTAAVPGRPAPLLLTADAVSGMRRGAIVVDCAAPRGGNCALTRADETVVTDHGVVILGPTNLPALVPHAASLMYSKNVGAFLRLLLPDGRLAPDEEDEIVRSTLVTRGGEIVNERVLRAIEGGRDD
jgi:NAD(P) transhydrogenase subunit alpha